MTAPSATRSRFSESALAALYDMRVDLRLIEDFVGGFTFESFERELKTRYATIRALELISDASQRLPVRLADRHPDLVWSVNPDADDDVPYKYDGVGVVLLWKIATKEIPPLLAIVEAELAAADLDRDRSEGTCS